MFNHFGTVSVVVRVWFGAGAMFVFLALAILYPNNRLSGFAMATKTCLPRVRMRSKGLCDRSWRLYIYCCILSALFFGTKLLSPKILTFRGLF